MSFPNLPNIPRFPDWLPRFGNLLRDSRTLRGLSIEQVAEAVGLDPGALRDIEKGKRAAPPKDIAAALADTLRLGKDEREAFLEAAELDSPMLGAILGRASAPSARRDTPVLPAAILVFLIADIRGYTHFTQQQGDEAAARLTARFAELAGAVAERWDGYLVEVRGDEVLAVFASARQALRAAHDLQGRYADEARGHPELPPGVGIGMDIGEAARVDDGYRGAALNRAARLCSLAGPGEVLVSTGVVYVAPQVDGVTFVARGQDQLKGFDGPVPILLAAPSEATPADDDEAGRDAEGAGGQEPA
jgi:class 3 adenylate cyclase